jgi:hypothetical protein
MLLVDELLIFKTLLKMQGKGVKKHKNLVRTVRNPKLTRTWHNENLVLYRHTHLLYSKVFIPEDGA